MKWKDFYDHLGSWAMQYGTRLVTGLLVLVVGIWVIRLLKKLARTKMSKREIHSSLQPFFLSLTITALNVLLFYLVLDIIGIDMAIFTTVIGTAGVAIGLALSGTFQNFAGGVLILLLKPFTLDDNIVAQGVDGYVTAIEVFYTEVLTHDNKAVIIPNGKLFNEIIINVTREGKQRLDLELKFSYGVDVEQVKKLISEAIAKTPEILTDHEPQIGIILLEADGFSV